MTPQERLKAEHVVQLGAWGDWECSCGKGNAYRNADLSGKTPRGAGLHLKAALKRIQSEEARKVS